MFASGNLCLDFPFPIQKGRVSKTAVSRSLSVWFRAGPLTKRPVSSVLPSKRGALSPRRVPKRSIADFRWRWNQVLAVAGVQRGRYKGLLVAVSISSLLPLTLSILTLSPEMSDIAPPNSDSGSGAGSNSDSSAGRSEGAPADTVRFSSLFCQLDLTFLLQGHNDGYTHHAGTANVAINRVSQTVLVNVRVPSS